MTDHQRKGSPVEQSSRSNGPAPIDSENKLPEMERGVQTHQHHSQTSPESSLPSSSNRTPGRIKHEPTCFLNTHPRTNSHQYNLERNTTTPLSQSRANTLLTLQNESTDNIEASNVSSKTKSCFKNSRTEYNNNYSFPQTIARTESDDVKLLKMDDKTKKIISQNSSSQSLRSRQTPSVRFVDEEMVPLVREYYYETEGPTKPIKSINEPAKIPDGYKQQRTWYKEIISEYGTADSSGIPVSEPLKRREEETMVKIETYRDISPREEIVGLTQIAHKDSLVLISKRGISLRSNSSLCDTDRGEHGARALIKESAYPIVPKDSLTLINMKKMPSLPKVDDNNSEFGRKPRHYTANSCQPKNVSSRNGDFISSGTVRPKSSPNRTSRNDRNAPDEMLTDLDEFRNRRSGGAPDVCDTSVQPRNWEASSPSSRDTILHSRVLGGMSQQNMGHLNY